VRTLRDHLKPVCIYFILNGTMPLFFKVTESK